MSGNLSRLDYFIAKYQLYMPKISKFWGGNRPPPLYLSHLWAKTTMSIESSWAAVQNIIHDFVSGISKRCLLTHVFSLRYIPVKPKNWDHCTGMLAQLVLQKHVTALIKHIRYTFAWIQQQSYHKPDLKLWSRKKKQCTCGTSRCWKPCHRSMLCKLFVPLTWLWRTHTIYVVCTV